MDVSVCMATYNGEKFINDQLNSILSQIDRNDELIIIDDCSKDNTAKIIKNYNDKRIKLFQNKTNNGHVYSFGRAISLASNNFIFLSDQDDIWIPGRVQLMKSTLQNTSALLVSSNFELMFSNDSILLPKNKLFTKESAKNFMNIIGIFLGKRSYFGCAMAFKYDLLKYILPFPHFIESHDLWIALVSNFIGKNWHLEQITLTRRIHTNNLTTSNRPLISKIKTRIIHIKSIAVIIKRILIK